MEEATEVGTVVAGVVMVAGLAAGRVVAGRAVAMVATETGAEMAAVLAMAAVVGLATAEEQEVGEMGVEMEAVETEGARVAVMAVVVKVE